VRSAKLALVLVLAASPALAAALYYPGDVLASAFYHMPAGGLAWSPDGSLLAVAHSGKLRVYYANGSLAWSLDLPGTPRGTAWAPPASGLVAVGVGDTIIVANESGVVAEASVGVQVNWVSWYPSSVIAAALDNGSVALYSLSTGELSVVNVSQAPLTAVAWASEGLVVGDAEGNLYLVSGGQVAAEASAGAPVIGATTLPQGGLVAFTTSEGVGVARATTRGLSVSVLDLASLGFEPAGPPAWSPCGSAIAVPAGEYLVVSDFDGRAPVSVAAAFQVKQPGYLYRLASWNPVDAELLAVAGVRQGGYTMLYILYSGSVLALEAEPPVVGYCFSGNCTSTLEANAVGVVEFAVQIRVDELGSGAREVIVPATLYVPPARIVELGGAEVLAKANLSVPEDKGLLIVLTSPDATVEARPLPGGPTYKLESNALLAPPGVYNIRVRLQPPSNWLGPEWALTRDKLLLLERGELMLLNYTWFTLDAVTAKLIVETTPGTTLTLRFTNDTVSTVVEAEVSEYTVPSGTYVIELTLPDTPNMLVPGPEVLSYRVTAALPPGDLFVVSLSYADLLGEIRVIGPDGARVEIAPPWGAPPWEGIVEGGRITVLAAPATYTARAHFEAPAGWVGPEPPTVEANLTVPEAGAVVEWNLYHYPEVLEWLDLVEQAAVISVRAPVGFPVVVAYDNVAVEAGRGSINLTAPPGEYVIRLVDPETGKVLDEERIAVEAGGRYAVILDFAALDGEGQAPAPQPAQPEEGPSVALIAAAIVAPLVAAIAAVLYLRRRPR